MAEERIEGMYDIGYNGYGNPCKYFQEALNSLLRCFGLGEGGGGGGEMADPPTIPSSDDPVTINPIDAPTPASATGLATRPPRGPISSGGPGQTD